MRIVHAISFRIRALFGHDRKQDSLDEEIKIHIEMLIDDFIAQGMPPHQARREALKEFGHAERFKEDCRDSWGVRFAADTYRDIKYGLKLLGKTKGFTAICLLTLCFCIAANTAFLSLAYNLLVRPYDFPNPDSVVNIGMQHRKSQYGEAVLMMSPRSYLDIEEGTESYVDTGLILINQSGDLDLDGSVSTVRYSLVSAGMWGVAGVSAAAGRLFTRDDLQNGDGHLVVLSDRMWKKYFNRSTAIIGSPIKIDGEGYRVLGVLPKGVTLTPMDADLWLPYKFESWQRSEQSRNYNTMVGYGRLKDGASIEQAQRELDAVYLSAPIRQTSEGETYDLDEERYALVRSTDFGPRIMPALKPIIWSTQGAFVAILLVGCLNIGGLILVRNMQRIGELEMRHTLGAPRSRLYRQLLTETLILFSLACALSFPAAKAALALLDSLVSKHFSQGIPTQIDPHVLLTVALGVLLTALVFGSLPTFSVLRNKLSRGSANRTYSTSSQTRWMQSAFVICLIAISSTLLVLTNAFFNKIEGTMSQDFGYDKENIFYVRVTLPKYLYPSKEDLDKYRVNIQQRLTEDPSIEHVSISTSHPLSFQVNETTFKVHGFTPAPTEQEPHGNTYIVSANHFSNLGIEILEGRTFQPSDAYENAEPSIIVSQSIAKDHLSQKQVIGAKIHFRGRDYHIIGMVNDTIDYPFHLPEPRHTLYTYERDFPNEIRNFCFIVKANENARNVETTLQKIVSGYDPSVTRIEVESSHSATKAAILFQLLPAELTVILSATAICLSMLGLYGVMAHLVFQKRKEIAIRSSLGARPRQLARELYWSSGKLAGAGLVLGLAIAYAGLSVIAYQFSLNSLLTPGSFILTALVIATTTLAATFVPVKRAQSAEIMDALKVG